jgi:hypothetical protein
MQLVIVCQVDRAKSAFAQQPLYPVATNYRRDIFPRIGSVERAHGTVGGLQRSMQLHPDAQPIRKGWKSLDQSR